MGVCNNRTMYDSNGRLIRGVKSKSGAGPSQAGLSAAERVVLEKKIDDLESQIMVQEAENRVLKQQLETTGKKHEESLYQTATVNRENQVQFAKYQKLEDERNSLAKQNEGIQGSVKSLEESGNVLRAAHERLFIDYKKVASQHDKMVKDMEAAKAESRELKFQVGSLTRYKEKFVATNKEIVKIYRDNKRLKHENTEIGKHFKEVETGYTLVFEEMQKRIKEGKFDLQVLYNKYKQSCTNAASVESLLDQQTLAVNKIQTECQQVRTDMLVQTEKNASLEKQIEGMKTTMEFYVSQVTKAAEEQENSHKHQIRKTRVAGENAVEKVRKELSVERNIIEERWKDRLRTIERKYHTVSKALNETISSQAQRIASLEETAKRQSIEKVKLTRTLRKTQKSLVRTEEDLTRTKEEASGTAHDMLKSVGVLPTRTFAYDDSTKERFLRESEKETSGDRTTMPGGQLIGGRRRLHSTSLLHAWG